MQISYICPHCGQVQGFLFKPEVGRKVQCWRCRKRFIPRKKGVKQDG